MEGSTKEFLFVLATIQPTRFYLHHKIRQDVATFHEQTCSYGAVRPIDVHLLSTPYGLASELDITDSVFSSCCVAKTFHDNSI